MHRVDRQWVGGLQARRAGVDDDVEAVRLQHTLRFDAGVRKVRMQLRGQGQRRNRVGVMDREEGGMRPGQAGRDGRSCAARAEEQDAPV